MARSPSPLVAVVIGREPDHRYSVHRGYVDAIAEVGGVPVVLPAIGRAHDRLLDTVAQADALLLTGGGDVDPARYSTIHAPEVAEVDPARDALEIWCYLAARERGRRVLGICRGIQVMAVAAGGHLYQHLPSAGFDGHWTRDREYEPVHAIAADPGTAASTALAGTTKVNSIHHQGILDPGELTATAWSDDGLIEAIEAEGALGVQWHPERLFQTDACHLAPFRWLVEAGKG
jgi:putative glutamine amidotransferase